MEITEVKIKLKPDRPPLKAFASITFDNCFVVHDLRVIQTEGKIFVAMPSKKVRDGNRLGVPYKDIVHPIKPEMRSLIEKAVLEKYKQAMENLNLSKPTV